MEYRNSRWLQRLQNFEKAFHSLTESREALIEDPENTFIQDSLIQRYEYSIELAWKTLKDFFEEEGFVDISSPKKVIRLGLREGYLSDDLWIRALNDRNKTSHAYDESMAEEVIEEIQGGYYFLLKDLLETLKREEQGDE